MLSRKKGKNKGSVLGAGTGPGDGDPASRGPATSQGEEMLSPETFPMSGLGSGSTFICPVSCL